MRIRGFGRVKRTARRLRNRFVPGGLILLYHRVADVERDPWSLCVSPHHFAEHLAVLKDRTTPVPLNNLDSALGRGGSSRRPVALTFDDGYADNLLHAKPMLERHDVPATVFVATGYTGGTREFWWDELDRLLLHPVALPEHLSLRVEGQRHDWILGEAATYPPDARRSHEGWRVEQHPFPTSRHAIYLSLWHLLRSMQDETRQEVLENLRKWAGATPEGRPSHRALTQEEVGILAKDGLVEIGAHTVHHPSLPALPRSVQRTEMCESKRQLEAWLNRPIESFAYPYGDHTPGSAAVAREVGFARACTTEERGCRAGADPFLLPRFEVHNWDGATFEKHLSYWFHE